MHKISGIPVVDNGKIVGIVTNRDLRFETNLDQPIKNIMTPRNKLVTVKEGAAKDEVMRLLHQYRLERLLVIDDKDVYKRQLQDALEYWGWFPQHQKHAGDGRIALQIETNGG